MLTQQADSVMKHGAMYNEPPNAGIWQKIGALTTVLSLPLRIPQPLCGCALPDVSITLLLAQRVYSAMKHGPMYN